VIEIGVFDGMATCLEMCGAIMVGNKNKWGFIVFLFGNVFRCGSAVEAGMVGLMVTCVVFSIINIRNWWKWGKIDDAKIKTKS
jgi:hypothetical protein